MPKIYYTYLENFSKTSISLAALNNFNEARKQKISTIKTEHGKQKSYLSGLLIQKIMKEQFNQQAKQIKIGTFGKPYLSSSSAHFNLSHSGNMIALAISNTDIGLDIQKPRTHSDKLLQRTFTKNEQNWLHFAQKNSDDLNNPNPFLTLWTAKESYLKAIGKGFTIPPNSFDVISGDSPAIKTLRTTNNHSNTSKELPQTKPENTPYCTQTIGGIKTVLGEQWIFCSTFLGSNAITTCERFIPDRANDQIVLIYVPPTSLLES